jgi:dynactin 1
MEELQIGQTVELSDGRVAIVRYVGRPHFATGDWVGVELEDDSGKNDGSVQGERYFDCPMGRGMFLRPAAVAVIAQPPPAAAPKANNGTAARPGRPASSILPASGRRLSTVPDASAGKRMSMNAASPSPAVKSSRPSSRPSSLLRVSTA